MPNIFKYSTITKRGEYLESVANPTGDFIASPNISALLSVPRQYWRVNDAFTAVIEMSQGEKDALDAEIAATALAERRAFADAMIDQTSGHGVELRALVLMLLDEINNLRQREVSWIALFAANSTLATIRTAVAALPGMPDRTISQAKTAYKNKITAGTAD